VSEAIVTLEVVTITDSDPAVVKGGRLVHYHKFMAYDVIVKGVLLAEIRAAKRLNSEGLGVNLRGEVSELGPVSHVNGPCCVLSLISIVRTRLFTR
jgi:hypothetical protein